MAKTTNCAMCGKEMQKGFFTGDYYSLFAGSELLDLCEDCYKKYKNVEKLHKKRFDTKLNALRYASRTKPTKEQIGAMFARYVEEAAKYAPKAEDAEPICVIGGFAKVTLDGRFSVMEASNDFLGCDVNAADMVKTMDKAMDSEEHWFTKDDITKIEYAYNDSGSFVGSFNKAYSYTIRLNDEKVMTYRPAITHAAAIGAGFLVGYRENADKQILKDLEDFRRAIGSDLPITKGSKR